MPPRLLLLLLYDDNLIRRRSIKSVYYLFKKTWNIRANFQKLYNFTTNHLFIIFLQFCRRAHESLPHSMNLNFYFLFYKFNHTFLACQAACCQRFKIQADFPFKIWEDIKFVQEYGRYHLIKNLPNKQTAKNMKCNMKCVF